MIVNLFSSTKGSTITLWHFGLDNLMDHQCFCNHRHYQITCYQSGVAFSDYQLMVFQHQKQIQAQKKWHKNKIKTIQKESPDQQRDQGEKCTIRKLRTKRPKNKSTSNQYKPLTRIRVIPINQQNRQRKQMREIHGIH